MNICHSLSQCFLEKIPTVLFYSKILHCYFEKILTALNSWNASQGKIPVLFAPAVARFQMSGWIISLYSRRMWNSKEYFEIPDTYDVASRPKGVIGQCPADGKMSWRGYWQMNLTIWAKQKCFWLLIESTRKALKRSTPFRLSCQLGFNRWYGEHEEYERKVIIFSRFGMERQLM